MSALLERSRTSTRTAVLVGCALGLGVLASFTVAGLLVADWSLSEFFAYLDLAVAGWLSLMTVLTVGIVAVPVVAALRFDLYSPLAVLGLVVVGWLAVGIGSGILSAQTVFGLALYAAMLAPLYLVLYGVLGGGEYLLRRRTTT